MKLIWRLSQSNIYEKVGSILSLINPKKDLNNYFFVIT